MKKSLLPAFWLALKPSSEPLTDLWYLLADSPLARSLGFQPAVRTVYQAAQAKLFKINPHRLDAIRRSL